MYSTLPELFARTGRPVFMHSSCKYRNQGIHDLVWGSNPWVSGISEQPPNAGDPLLEEYVRLDSLRETMHRIEIAHGFLPTNLYPRIYYAPKFDQRFRGYVLVDMGSTSMPFESRIAERFLSYIVARYKYGEERLVQAMFKQAVASLGFGITNVAAHTFADIFEYCDAIRSCEAFITTEAGSQVLGSAIRRNELWPRIHVLMTDESFNHKQFVFPNVEYYIAPYHGEGANNFK